MRAAHRDYGPRGERRCGSAIRLTTGTLVKIDGWFKAEDVEDFVRVFDQLEGNKTLELSELKSADRAAVVMFRELIASGVRLRGASPYMELLLKTEPNTT